MKLLLAGFQSPIIEFLARWTLTLLLGWMAHGLLRSQDARCRLILWRGVFCFGLVLPLTQIIPLPTFQVTLYDFSNISTTTPSVAGGSVLNSKTPASRPALVEALKNSGTIYGIHSSERNVFSTVSWTAVLIAFWAAGALCGSLRLLRYISQLSTLRKTSMAAGSSIQELAEDILQRWRIKRSIRVLVSDSTVLPFIFGIFHPAIMIPKKLAQSLTTEEMETLLGHEIAHLRGHDLWWCAGWRWMRVMLWFHPLIWKVPAAHSLACEEEADRAASTHMRNRAYYARMLAQLSLRVLAMPEVENPLTANGTAQISQRLYRLGNNLGAWKQRHSIAAWGLVGAIALVSAGCNVNKANDTQEVERLKIKIAELETRLKAVENLGKQNSRLSQPTEQEQRQRAYREKFNRRGELDLKNYTAEQLAEIENIYQATGKKWRSPDYVENVNQMLQQFPDANRSGCLLLELALNTTGPAAEKYLKDSIEKYNDCYYGDGVQVGPFARFCLAEYYRNAKENEKAQALYKEIKENYPDAIDHHGELLMHSIK